MINGFCLYKEFRPAKLSSALRSLSLLRDLSRSSDLSSFECRTQRTRYAILKSSQVDVPYKKGVPKIIVKFTKNHVCWSLSVLKLQN